MADLVSGTRGMSRMKFGECLVQGITLQGKEPWAKYFEER